MAHDTWLLPEGFDVAPQSAVALDLTSGMKFPTLETGPKRERVKAAHVRLDGQTIDITELSEDTKSLRLKTPALTEPGVAAIWVLLPPKAIELKPDRVAEYLDEIDASPELRQQWKATQPQRWREFYTKHAKTFVRIGEPTNDRSWGEPVGDALEIIPEEDPTTLRVGDNFTVRVVKDGTPFAEFAINALAAGESKGETRRTDADGRVTFHLTKPDAWLLRGTDLRKAGRADAEWESDFVTLTVEVRGVQP